jgi:hypothetical protein
MSLWPIVIALDVKRTRTGWSFRVRVLITF